MGTLFNQSPRCNRYNQHRAKTNMIDDIKMYMKELHCDVSTAIKAAELFEKVEWNIFRITDLDIKDEQLAGFGELWMETNRLLGEYLEND